jgi:hypothetical protein
VINLEALKKTLIIFWRIVANFWENPGKSYEFLKKPRKIQEKLLKILVKSCENTRKTLRNLRKL